MTMDTGATFSPCRTWRYDLWRIWNQGPLINFICQNPSTADETVNDPTVERLERRARRWGYAGLVVTNVFAFRSTDPSNLLTAADPIGPQNDVLILYRALEAETAVCAWSAHRSVQKALPGQTQPRGAAVEEILRRAGVNLYFLRLTKSGCPEHPLYLKYDLTPTPWEKTNAQV